jgi:hypothetical protein
MPALKSVTRSASQQIPPESDKLSALLQKILDANGKTIVPLKTVLLHISQKKPTFSPDAIELAIRVLMAGFATPLPFTLLTRGYRRIFFSPCDYPESVALCYDLFTSLNAQQPDYPDDLVKLLVKRVASASCDDRTRAKDCLLSIDPLYSDQILHHVVMLLIPAPPHGTDLLLECASNLIPLSPYSPDLELLESVFHVLHFAPHYQTFSEKLIGALVAWHETDWDRAVRSRLFILNNWPRLDPQRAILFLEEATAICLNGPPVDPFLWERLSFRASSIHSQLATVGLSFIQQTIKKVSGIDFSVLRFLLEDASKSHWAIGVREKAAEVLKVIPEVAPAPPKVLSIERWNIVKEMAQANYPNQDFGGRRKVRK